MLGEIHRTLDSREGEPKDAVIGVNDTQKQILLLVKKNRAIVPLSGWAKTAQLNPSAVLNKAKRQTIPAFRVREKWMIDAAYELPEDQKVIPHV